MKQQITWSYNSQCHQMGLNMKNQFLESGLDTNSESQTSSLTAQVNQLTQDINK